MKLPAWLVRIEPDPPPQDPTVRALERERVIQNIVRRYLERDDVREGVEDWLANAYDDSNPPVTDLYNRIAVERDK